MAFVLFGGLGLAQEAFLGDWQGEIGPGSLNLGVVVHFESTAEGLSGSIDIAAQGAQALPLTIGEVAEQSIAFVIQGVPGNASFVGRLEQDKLVGEFSQAGQHFPFLLERLSAAGSTAPETIEAYLGNWEGVIGKGSTDLKIGLSFSDAEGVMEADIVIPAQGFKGKLKIQELSETTISLLIQGIPGNPRFQGELVGDRISGIFSQSGQDLDFSLSRSLEALSTKRPQDPTPPFPYSVEEVEFSSGDTTIAGSLTIPEGDAAFPAIIMITGSGPQNRDEELLGHRPFLVISDALSRAGFAVLRTDDRGVGGSSGELSQASYAQLADDVIAGLEFLKTRTDIDPGRIGLFGHSEGGYLAPLVASQRSDLAFIIMMAAPSVAGLEVLELQNRLILQQEGESETEIAKQIAFLRLLADALKREAYDEAASLTEARVKESFAAMAESEKPSEELQAQIIETQVANVANPYFRNVMVFDPQPYLRELRLPVLAFYGSKDIQVDAEQSLEPLRAALQEAANSDVTLKVFEGLNHLMQPAVTGAISEYGDIEITIAPEVLEFVIAWLRERFLD